MRTFARVLAVLCIIVGLAGCSGDGKEGGWSPFITSDGTGVRGLDTPDQILSNPYVEEALAIASDEGVNITPEKGVNPPVITGFYNLSGGHYYPDNNVFSPGTWRWSNQTSDNRIDTDYDQGLQIGGGVEGEIIRGTGNEFTVYAILNVSMYGVTERCVLLVDGRQGYNGNITATYIFTPPEEPQYFGLTIGYMDLTLTGAAKTTLKGDGGGAFLMNILKNALELPSNQDNGSK